MKAKRAVLVFGATAVGLVAFLSSFSYGQFVEDGPGEAADGGGAPGDEEASADDSFDSSLSVEEDSQEPPAALSPFAAFLFSVKDFIKPLVEPSAAKADFGRLYMEAVLPVFKALYPEHSQQIESLLRMSQQMDDELVEVYEALKALRDQILGEPDATKKQALKSRMEELVNRMETLYDERIDFSTSLAGLDSVQVNAILQNPTVKDVKGFVESIITVPFRKLT